MPCYRQSELPRPSSEIDDDGILVEPQTLKHSHLCGRVGVHDRVVTDYVDLVEVLPTRR